MMKLKEEVIIIIKEGKKSQQLRKREISGKV